VLPTQLSLSHPVPVVRLTFSRSVNWLTKACAFSYAAPQSPRPSIHLDNVSKRSQMMVAGQCFAGPQIILKHPPSHTKPSVMDVSDAPASKMTPKCMTRTACGIGSAVLTGWDRTAGLSHRSRDLTSHLWLAELWCWGTVYGVSSGPNTARKRNCTERRNGKRPRIRCAISGNISAALIRVAHKTDGVGECDWGIATDLLRVGGPDREECG
jgi:hypothetical protein